MISLKAPAAQRVLPFLFIVLSLALPPPRARGQEGCAPDSLAAQVADLAELVRQTQLEMQEQRRLIESQGVELQSLRSELARARNEVFLVNGSDRHGEAAHWREANLRREVPTPATASVVLSMAAPPAQQPAASPAAPAAAAQSPAAPADPGTLRAYWRDGLRLDSADRNFRLTIGGRIHNDWAAFSSAEHVEGVVGPLQDGTEFRRARLHVTGQIYENVNFKAEYDFAGGLTFKDVYVGLSDLPVIGNVRAGHFKEPFTLEELTSDNYITFLERSLVNAFAPSRKAGIMAFNALPKQRMTWQLGVFRDTNAFGDGTGDGKYNLTGRITGRPLHRDEGRKLIHLGLAYSRRKPLAGLFRLRARPETHLAPFFADTGSFSGSTLHLLGTEAALVVDRASLQSEYTHVFVDRPAATRANFSAFYVQGSYFLTGEYRVYETGEGLFGRVRPRHDFEAGPGKGWGAWELVARYSRIDLADEPIFGGRLRDVTLGMNWYLNPNTKIMWNYVSADRIDVGRAGIFQTRFQVDF